MTEAVIVSTARSPIGRAGKGSLVDMRPDDLAVQMVKAALDKVPGLDPKEITDLHLGVGQPAGEAGHNLARAVAVLSGMDRLPLSSVRLFCSFLSLHATHSFFGFARCAVTSIACMLVLVACEDMRENLRYDI